MAKQQLIRISPLTRELRRFWAYVHQPGADRLSLLRRFAHYKTPTAHRYLDVRRGSRRFPPACGECFACQQRPATVWHHVIQIQHGGRNFERNKVPLCRSCHRQIHPWLKKVQPVKVTPIDMTPRLVRRTA